MNFQIRCPECGRGYLIDEGRIPTGGGYVPCQDCGANIVLPPRSSAPPAPAKKRVLRAGEVCCPRCQLHFVPETQTTSAPAAVSANVPGPAPAPASPGPDRPRILIVEDMDYFLQIARDALSTRYEVKTAKTIEEARAHLIAGGIDLLLLDLTLQKGEDGLRLLHESPGKICPVLLFTAQDESEMYGDGWSKLQALGVDDVIIKGMNMDEALQRKVAEMLGEPETEDAARA